MMKSQPGADTFHFQHEEEREYALASMQKYYRTKPEQVKFFEQLVGPYLAAQPEARVLDACCGLGDLTYFLSQLSPRTRFLGIDKASFLLDQAREQFKSNPNIGFEVADVHALSGQFGPKAFDLAVCKQTLSWLPTYEQAVEELMTVTRKAIFASSLFYDGRIDFNTRVREHVTESGQDDYNAFYNIYSFPVFREFCIAAGAKEVLGFDFKIGIDLPQPESLDRMATYTVKLESGERLQISGALLLPWKIVRIDL